MTARHATPQLAIELNERAGARELVLRDHSGLVTEELIVELRPSATGGAVLQIEHWRGMDLAAIEFWPSVTQLRVLGSALLASADQAEALA